MQRAKDCQMLLNWRDFNCRTVYAVNLSAKEPEKAHRTRLHVCVRVRKSWKVPIARN